MQTCIHKSCCFNPWESASIFGNYVKCQALSMKILSNLRKYTQIGCSAALGRLVKVPILGERLYIIWSRLLWNFPASRISYFF